MFRKLVRFIEEEDLFYRDQKILVAVSGGVDSVVLLHLMKKLEVECAVAHCNFHLRGEESDADTIFVQQLAENWQIPFHTIDFKTKDYAKKNKQSIEMAARELRYNWFEELCKEYHYDYIAVGHHADDVAETVLINLCRGTGIHGLTGIKAKLGKVIRPLLPFSRQELLEYAKQNQIDFREDSTNQETDFVRNKIRHQVLPVLEKINPGIRKTMSENVQRFREVEKIYNHSIENQKKNIIQYKEDQIQISIQKLQNLVAPSSYLFEILSSYGFHHRDVKQIAKSLDSISGKRFYSATHQVLRDRDYLLLSPIEIKKEDQEFELQKNEEELHEPLFLQTKVFAKSENFQFPKEKTTACFDLDTLHFPLKIRKWKQGDTFCPIGMKGKKKKLSDFFIDQKFTLQEKENTWLLISNEQIVWVIGHRMDDNFKISATTKSVFQIEI